MESEKSKTKTSHALGMLSMLEELRGAGLICDFVIKVGKVEYPTHRVVLAATSKYFRAMLTTDMKEAKEGYVNMLNLEQNAFQKCLEFIYNGNTVITDKDVVPTLSAASLMQLDGLVKLCFKFLCDNISSKNCVFAVRMAKMYANDELKAHAEKHLMRNMEKVILSEEFPTISCKALLRYINQSKANHKITWKAVVAWLMDDSEKIQANFKEIVKGINIPTFPFEVFSTIVLQKNFIKISEDLNVFTINQWFSSVGWVKLHTSVDNYFDVKNLAEKKGVAVPVKVAEFLIEFLETNYQKLSQKDDFLGLEEKYIRAVFDFFRTQDFPEKWKWETAVKWCKHQENRRSIFLDLFRKINLKLLPAEFIESVIRFEPMVKESHLCKDILLDHYGQKSASPTGITCLDSSTGEIKTFNIPKKQWSILSPVQPVGVIDIVGLNEELYFIKHASLHKLSRNGGWTALSASTRRFDLPNRVVCFRDCIYVVGSKCMSLYSPVENCWWNNLPGCDLGDNFQVAASEDAIYALEQPSTYRGRRFRKYGCDGWAELPPVGELIHHDFLLAYRHQLLLLGGEDNKGQPVDFVRILDPGSFKWNGATIRLNRPMSRRFTAFFLNGNLCTLALDQSKKRYLLETIAPDESVLSDFESRGAVLSCLYHGNAT